MGVDEKVILILLEDTLGAVKFCCCGCRMALSQESQDVGGGVCLNAEGCGHFGWASKESDGQWSEQLKCICASLWKTRSNEESFF